MNDQLHRADRVRRLLGRPRSFTRGESKRMMGNLARVDPGHSPHGASAEPRVPELDGLRGLACLTILVYHFRPALVPYGWASVDLFFVLSGYLITTILIRHAGAPRLLWNFYARRGLRIWPVYYLTILALAIAGPWLPRPTDWAGLAYYLTYTQNLPLYWSGQVPAFSPYAGHLWTLANEEQFYIIWPLLVVMLGRRGVIPLGLGLAALSVWARARGFSPLLLLARADGFALGGILAAMLANPEKVTRQLTAHRRGFAALTLIAIVVVAGAMARGVLPTFGRPPTGAAFSVLAINLVFAGLVGLVATHAGSRAVAWLRRPRLVHLGTLSYGLYVYHYIILALSDDMLVAYRGYGRTSPINVPVILLIYVAAAVSWAWFEKPILELKARFAYQSSTASEYSSVTSLSPGHMAARGS